MKTAYAVVGCLLLLCQCKQSTLQPPPEITALIGTWTLMQPDSAASTTLSFTLDTANPPHDITSFYVQGNGLQSAYSGRMYATVDGTMQIQQLAQTDGTVTTNTQKIDHLYLIKLGSTARFSRSSDSTLRLYFGSPSSGILSYKKSR